MAGPVASLGGAGRRAIPRLTTLGQARLSPAACMLAVCLLPPSGHSVHWALRPEGHQPLRQTWCLPSSLAGMSVPMAIAQVEASMAQSWGGADKTGVGGTFGSLNLILCLPHTCRSQGCTPTPSQTCPTAPWTWLSWRGWSHGALGAPTTRSVSSFAWRTPTAARGAGSSPWNTYAR